MGNRVRTLIDGTAAFAVLAVLSFAQTYQEKKTAALRQIDAVIEQGFYKAYWQSLEDYHVPQWYMDAKFGIFLHWGLCAVPAFDDWYARNMYLKSNEKVFRHHVETYGPQSKFGYKDFIPQLTFAKFDPAHYASLFERAGAKFVVPVAEHHDGFPMYACSFTDWNAARMGPSRDVVAALGEEVRKRGLHFGVSSHRAENWWFYEGGREFDSDVQDPRNGGLYGPAQPRGVPPNQEFLEDWLARTCEMVDKFKPDVVWFDWWIGEAAFQPYLQKFAAYYYNRAAEWKQGAVIQYKFHAFPEKAAVLDLERGQLGKIRPMVWQNDTSVSTNSWFHLKNPDYRTPDSLVDDLMDIVSKNGILLLNIGPTAEGGIPEEEERLLLEVGKWLAVNGEVVYGTRPWKTFGEGPTEVVEGSFHDTARKAFTSRDIRFTAKGETLYAIGLEWPENGNVTIQSLGTNSPYTKRAITSVELVGSRAKLKWSRSTAGLMVELPARRTSEYAYALKISPVDVGQP